MVIIFKLAEIHTLWGKSSLRKFKERKKYKDRSRNNGVNEKAFL